MRALWVFVAATTFAALPMAAQTTVGFEGGFVSATLRTSDHGIPTNTVAGILVGASIDHDLGPHFSLAPEAMYIHKGGKFTETDGTVDAITLDYVEVPVLFRWTLAARKLPHSFLTAGPTIAFQLSCTDQYTGTDLSGSTDCKSLGAHTGFKSTDAGFLFGAGIDVKRAMLAVRYDIGMTNVSQETGAGAVTLKNRALTLQVGYTL